MISADLNNIVVSDNGKILTKFEGGNVKFSADLKSFEGTVTLTNTSILPSDLWNNLKSEKLTLNIKKDKIELPKTQMTFGGTGFEVNGKITDYTSKTPDFDFDIAGKLNSTALYDVIKRQKGAEKLLAATKGNVGVVGNIKGVGQKITVKADLTANRDNYISCFVIKELLGMPSLTKVYAEFDGKNLDMKEVSLNKNGVKKETILSLQGKVLNVQKPRFDKVRVVIPNAMTFALAGLKNSEITVKSDILLNGTPEKPSVQGDLEIRNINVPEYKLHSQTNKITFDADNIKVNLPNLQIGNSVFNVETSVPATLKQPFVLRGLKLKSSSLE